MSILATKKKQMKHKWVIAIIFLVLPWIVFLIGYNPFTTACAPGDGDIYGLSMQLFSRNLQVWNPFLASGKSQLAEVGSQAVYLPAKLIMSIFPNCFGYNLLLLLHYSFAGYFTYRFIKELDLEEYAAIIGGIAFMFCGFMVAHKGHNTMVCVAAYLPCILFLLERYITTEKTRYLIIVSLVWGLSITADYTACSMYIGMVSFPYLIYRFISKSGKNLKKALLKIVKTSICLYGLGTLLAAYYLFPILESLNTVTREKITYDFFIEYSFPIKQIGMILFPFLFGGEIGSVGYFGQWNATEITGYTGILVLVIAITCVVYLWKKNSAVKFWTIIAGVSFLLVLGGNTPLYKIMYHVPLYNMFRVPARNWLECNFAVCILLAYGISTLIRENEEGFEKLYARLKRVFLWTCVVGAGILVAIRIIVVLAQVFTVNPQYADIIDKLNQNVSVSSISIGVTIIAFVLAAIDIFFIKKNREKKSFWLLTACLVLVDLFPVAYYHDNIRTEDYQTCPTMQQEESSVAEWFNANIDKDSSRIWDVASVGTKIRDLMPTKNQNKGIMSISSYGPVWDKTYADMTGFDAAGIVGSTSELIKSNQVLSMLNTRYLIVNPENKHIVENSGQVNADVQGMNEISKWDLVNSGMDHQDRVLLDAAQSEYSLIQYKISSMNDLCLQYSIQVDADELDDGIYVDLWKEDGTILAQQYYSPDDIDNADGSIIGCISADGTYTDVYLRIYTYSKNPIQLRNLCFEDVHVEDGTYVKRFEDENGNAVYENTKAVDRAYFVQNVLPEINVEAQVKMLKYSEVDLTHSSLTEESINEETFAAGEIVTSTYENSRIKYEVETKGKSFLVLTDSYYPGWNAYVDGKKTEIYRVNAIQRGIIIDGEGVHQVEFRFQPKSLYYGIVVSVVALLILFGIPYWRKVFRTLKHN